MSQHAIEDLVEDSIRLVDCGDMPSDKKRQLIHGLLWVQALYDTRLTWFRVTEILLKYGVLSRTQVDPSMRVSPREQKMLEDVDEGWVDPDCSGSMAYLSIENDVRMLYRMNNDIDRLSAPEVIASILHEAENRNATAIVNSWYGLLVKSWIEGELGPIQGFPDSFEGLVEHAVLCGIRALAQRVGVKRSRSVHDDLSLPVLTDELDGASEPGFAYGVRFFLDLKKPLDVLADAAKKAAERQGRNTILLERWFGGGGRFDQVLSSQGWRSASAAQPNRWQWIQDVEGHRRFVWFDLEPRDNLLMCHLGLQHARLLSWQKRSPSDLLYDVHFYRLGGIFVPKDVRSEQMMYPFGGWKFDLGKSEKVLTATIDHVIESVPLMVHDYFEFLACTFSDAYFARNADALIDLLENGEGDTGTVPEDVLFTNKYSLLLAFAYHALEAGHPQNAEAYIEQVRNQLAAKKKLSRYDERYLSSFLRQWSRGGRDLAMPPQLHFLLMQHLESEHRI